MLKNLLILPDGTELFSGTGTVNAIKSITLTECVNSNEELTLGSTCANMIEAQLFTPNGGLSLTAGDEVTLYRVEEDDTRHKVGVFILEKPTRTTANTMKLTGYDNVVKLDKDLTDWLAGLTGWPYNILTFASMVCGECNVSFVPGDVPNQDFSVEKFSASGVTGRQLMKWIGEVTCSFCRANADGKIELGWYTPLTNRSVGWKSDRILYDKYIGELSFESAYAKVSEGNDGEVKIDSDHFSVTDDGQGNVVLVMVETLPYFQNSLGYEDYDVRSVEAVQIQLGSGEDAYRWPAVAEGANTYVFVGNPLMSELSDRMLTVLDSIKNRLSAVTYTPCKVSIPVVLDVKAGDVLSITDKNRKVLTVYAMTVKTTGQKLTVECTGSYRRDSTTAQNNQSVSQVAQNIAQNVAADTAKKAVDGQTQQDVFNKLTENGKLQGLYMKDGQLYINASYLRTGVISSEDGAVQIDLSAGATEPVFNTGISTNGISVRGDTVGAGTLFKAWADYLTANGVKVPTIAVAISSADGCGIGAISEVFNSSYEPAGLQFRFLNHDQNRVADIVAAENIAGLRLRNSASGGIVGTVLLNADGLFAISGLSKLNEKTISWKDNGDGTFTLIGK